MVCQALSAPTAILSLDLKQNLPNRCLKRRPDCAGGSSTAQGYDGIGRHRLPRQRSSGSARRTHSDRHASDSFTPDQSFSHEVGLCAAPLHACVSCTCCRL